MTAAVLALALCWAQPAQAGLFGGGSGKKAALLWVPEQKSLDWSALRALLERHPKARLTVALDPEGIPESALPWLVQLSSQSRIEVALRIPGDPILPLLGRYRARDFLDRLALGRARYKQLFERPPAGFVAGAGTLSPELAQPLAKQGFAWTTAGDSALRSPWYTPGNLVVVPFHSPSSAEPAELVPPEGGCATVLQEGGDAVEPGQGLELLRKLLDDEGAWTSVTGALEDLSPYAAGPDSWPGWEGEISAWTSDAAQKRAWELYGQAVEALRRYEDSGAARLDTLNQATQQLYAIQASRYYRPDSLKSPAVEKEFKAHLQKIYRLIGQAPPRALGAASAPKAETGKTPAPAAKTVGGKPSDEADEGAPGDEEGDWRVRSGIEGRSLWFENPAGSQAAAPEPPPALAAGTAPHDPWTPKQLKVRWDEKAVVFVFAMNSVDNTSKSSAGMGTVMLDLYMDINHLAGRGSTTLLPGRWGFLPPRDAWEYVLVTTGWGCGLYRSNPGQPPSLVTSLRPEVDARGGEIRVSVPRSALRGNPSGWGYLLLTLATDRAHAEAAPPEPGGRGRPVLGLLGPLQAQAGAKKAAAGKYQRFSALRIED